MKYIKSEDKYFLHFEPEDNIVPVLESFVTEAGIQNAMISGIGAGHHFELGYLDESTGKYDIRNFDGQYEILSFLGNVNNIDGKPIVHIHITLSDKEFNAFGGHLFNGIVAPKLQMIITPV